MAQLTINVPDNAKAKEIIDFFALEYGWNSTMGITKANFFERCIERFIEGVWRKQKLYAERAVTDKNVSDLPSPVINVETSA